MWGFFGIGDKFSIFCGVTFFFLGFFLFIFLFIYLYIYLFTSFFVCVLMKCHFLDFVTSGLATHVIAWVAVIEVVVVIVFILFISKKIPYSFILFHAAWLSILFLSYQPRRKGAKWRGRGGAFAFTVPCLSL